MTTQKQFRRFLYITDIRTEEMDKIDSARSGNKISLLKIYLFIVGEDLLSCINPLVLIDCIINNGIVISKKGL